MMTPGTAFRRMLAAVAISLVLAGCDGGPVNSTNETAGQTAVRSTPTCWVIRWVARPPSSWRRGAARAPGDSPSYVAHRHHGRSGADRRTGHAFPRRSRPAPGHGLLPGHGRAAQPGGRPRQWSRTMSAVARLRLATRSIARFIQRTRKSAPGADGNDSGPEQGACLTSGDCGRTIGVDRREPNRLRPPATSHRYRASVTVFSAG